MKNYKLRIIKTSFQPNFLNKTTSVAMNTPPQTTSLPHSFHLLGIRGNESPNLIRGSIEDSNFTPANTKCISVPQEQKLGRKHISFQMRAVGTQHNVAYLRHAWGTISLCFYRTFMPTAYQSTPALKKMLHKRRGNETRHATSLHRAGFVSSMKS